MSRTQDDPSRRVSTPPKPWLSPALKAAILEWSYLARSATRAGLLTRAYHGPDYRIAVDYASGPFTDRTASSLITIPAGGGLVNQLLNQSLTFLGEVPLASPIGSTPTPPPVKLSPETFETINRKRAERDEAAKRCRTLHAAIDGLNQLARAEARRHETLTFEIRGLVDPENAETDRL